LYNENNDLHVHDARQHAQVLRRVRCNFPTLLNMSASDRLRLGSLAPLQCLQQIANEKRERERLALLGDRVLSLHVSERLLQRDATASAGEVTIRKLCYEMAASHAAFLRSTADAAALFAAAMESGSEHSLSTHFEALVGLLYGTGAHLALLDPFVRWCEVHAPSHQQCVSLALLPRSLLDVMLDLDTDHLVWSDASAQRPQESAAIDERLVSAVGRAVRPQPIVVTPQTAVAIAQSAGSWQPIVSLSTSRSHPAEAVVAVEWRSIQQYDNLSVLLCLCDCDHTSQCRR
jgi:23S rRNA maturation mini-RNase III